MVFSLGIYAGNCFGAEFLLFLTSSYPISLVYYASVKVQWLYTCSIIKLLLGHPEVNVCFRFPESLFRMRVGRSEPRYLVPSKSVSKSQSSALHNRNAHSSTTCYRIFARAQTE